MKSVSVIASLMLTSSVDAYRVNLPVISAVGYQPKAEKNYGDPLCPCVGIDGLIWGETTVSLGDGKTAPYPADLGARCEAWDNDNHKTSCVEGGKPGHGKGWCAQPWCYVDPCSCNIATLPKQTSYLPDAKFQDKPVYYSYATCGGSDVWASAEQQKATQKVESLCIDRAPMDAKVWGNAFCRCIGIAYQPGTTDVYIEGKSVPYEADTGAVCKAWDNEKHPKCGGGAKQPDWCEKKWCYVDPCNCDIDTAPKTSAYLPGATFRHVPIYYSYATCGFTDSWVTSKGNEKKVVNRKPKECALNHPLTNTSWHPKIEEHSYNQTKYTENWRKEYGEHAKDEKKKL